MILNKLKEVIDIFVDAGKGNAEVNFSTYKLPDHVAGEEKDDIRIWIRCLEFEDIEIQDDMPGDPILISFTEH